MKRLSRFLGFVLLSLFVAGGVFGQAESVFQFVSGFGIRNGENIPLEIQASETNIISYEVLSRTGGVIFLAVAVPAGSAAGQPVSLEYKPGLPDGQRLTAVIGTTAVSTGLYDWQFIPAARFAGSVYTAGVTLLGGPKTDSEETQHTRYTMWAEFHPGFINTLAGLNLFFVDAMLVDKNINRMRGITGSANGDIPGYNDIPFNNKISALNSSSIINLLVSYAETWDSYIYTDYGVTIRYELRDGRIVFSGVPSYLFVKLNHKTGTAVVAEELNRMIRQNIRQVEAINPIIYRAAEQTAQWAAFFRMVKEQYPRSWELFMGQIAGIDDGVPVKTPRSWLRQ